MNHRQHSQLDVDLLAQHPEVEARLHAELDAVLGGRPPGLEDLPNLTYTEMVVKEAMRLYPAAWAISREAIEDVRIAMGRCPASVAGVMIYFTQRDPRWWPDPECLDPEQFGEESGNGDPALCLPALRRRATRLHRQRLCDDGGTAFWPPSPAAMGWSRLGSHRQARAPDHLGSERRHADDRAPHPLSERRRRCVSR